MKTFAQVVRDQQHYQTAVAPPKGSAILRLGDINYVSSHTTLFPTLPLGASVASKSGGHAHDSYSGLALHETNSDRLLELSRPHRVASDNELARTCQVCKRAFPLKKTLNRHVKSVHSPTQETPFVCTRGTCGKRFKRKDILSRHQTTQHNERRMIECDVCYREVRPRYLPQHRATQACQEAVREAEARVEANVEADASRIGVLGAFCILRTTTTGSTSVPAYLPAVVDVLLICTWMFVRLRPWGRESSGLWLLTSTVAAPSIEVLELKGLAYRTIWRALRRHDPAREPHLYDAVIVLAIVDRMISGWDATASHREVSRYLARCGYSVGTGTVDAYETALSRDVDSSQVASCLRLMRTVIGLVHECALYVTGVSTSDQAAQAEAHELCMREERWSARNAGRLTELADLASTIAN